MLKTYIDDSKSDEKVIYTTTNEPFMPVRLYYTIHNEYLLIKALRRLKCIELQDNKHFILSYFKEAKNLDLEVHYQNVPEGLYPIILAEGHIKQGKRLHLDTKSLRRAVLVMDFLAKHIPHTIAEVTHFANSNKLTTSINKEDLEAIIAEDYDKVFAEDVIQDIDFYNIEDTGNIEVSSNYDSHEDIDNLERGADDLREKIRKEELKSYPDVERIKINYNKNKHSDLINLLTFRSYTKEMVAMEHYKGNINYCSIDAIDQLIKNVEELEGNNSKYN